MNGLVCAPCTPSLNNRRRNSTSSIAAASIGEDDMNTGMPSSPKKPKPKPKPSFLTWTAEDVVNVARFHWVPCIFAVGLLVFMGVEYTILMVPSTSPPLDLGFIATRSLHRLLSSSPTLNTFLAFLNTASTQLINLHFFNIGFQSFCFYLRKVFVGMQAVYILWAWLIEGRPRATIAALFMFTCRGILGSSTQLPLPHGFLGSGVDFPVGNVSFFLFFSGHVAGSLIASLDMRRMQRLELAWSFDLLNVLQGVRLLGTRGHYTIDLAVGVGAGILFDFLAGKYEETKRKPSILAAAATTTIATKETLFT
ncbi:hypothetical protein FEM48_Zijuj01G0306600 [Ziziphus jujuba var. spinosa]|uniref:AtPDCT1/2 transmembrane domain-containing protein n=1 Tax=Ziziphus jujuba var. spinosa TaxID=714518 RepID=A0A978W625_ZIZJJ|nr:hypothetical protein FEM48_Zijuj01G0306600 [Ziziphus jujuba var. spinosa]